MLKRFYGWRPDKKDRRDLPMLLQRPKVMPPMVDLQPQDVPILDQLQLGSCTANAIAGCVMFDLKKQGLQLFTPSRLFIYYNERNMEGTVNEDSGAAIRDGIKTINTLGVCSEAEWPYDISQFAVQPSSQCFTDALKNKSVLYRYVRNVVDDMRICLANGYPFAAGMQVFSEFESGAVATTGIVPMPADTSNSLGGHAIKCVGFNDNNQMFKFANSWSANWGAQGYFYLPYDYVQFMDDMWTIQTMTEEALLKIKQELNIV